MEGFSLLLAFCVFMFLGAYLAGAVPLMFSYNIAKLRWVSIFGAGLLVGTALVVIIPEGVAMHYESQLKHEHVAHLPPGVRAVPSLDEEQNDDMGGEAPQTASGSNNKVANLAAAAARDRAALVSKIAHAAAAGDDGHGHSHGGGGGHSHAHRRLMMALVSDNGNGANSLGQSLEAALQSLTSGLHSHWRTLLAAWSSGGDDNAAQSSLPVAESDANDNTAHHSRARLLRKKGKKSKSAPAVTDTNTADIAAAAAAAAENSASAASGSADEEGAEAEGAGSGGDDTTTIIISAPPGAGFGRSLDSLADGVVAAEGSSEEEDEEGDHSGHSHSSSNGSGGGVEGHEHPGHWQIGAALVIGFAFQLVVGAYGIFQTQVIR